VSLSYTRSDGADENRATLDAGLSFEEVKKVAKKYGMISWAKSR